MTGTGPEDGPNERRPGVGQRISNKSRSRIRLAALLGGVALVATALAAYQHYSGPRYAWRQAIRDPDRKAREATWTRLQRDKEIRGLDTEATAREVIAALGDPNPETRRLAVATLPSLELDPARAISALAALLLDATVEVRASAASALGEAVRRDKPGREPALGTLEFALKDASPLVRRAAAAAVGQVVYESGSAVDPLRSGRADDPALVPVAKLLSDPVAAVKVEAAYVLACNGRGGDAVPMLAALVDAQPADKPLDRVADRAFLALMVLATHSDGAADFLGAELSKPREGNPERPREALAWAARQSGEARARVRRVAEKALDPARPSTRHTAALLLHQIGSDQAALPVLIEALGDPSAEVRGQAVEALADLGDVDPMIVPALELASHDARVEVRERALAALEAIEWDEILNDTGMETAAP